jgi:phospholipid-transporting ATPase
MENTELQTVSIQTELSKTEVNVKTDFVRHTSIFSPPSGADTIHYTHQVHLNNYDANYPKTLKNLLFPKFPTNYIRSTKYLWWTFLFQNLLEQLTRFSNIYFIIVMILALIPGVSPIFPITSIFPVVFILGVTMVKDGIEDLIRWVTDIRVNGTKFETVRHGELVNVSSANLLVGDIIKVENDEMFPCDLLFLSANDPSGIGFVSTVNLNGESNLKLHSALSCTRTKRTAEELSTLSGYIECEKPRFELEIINAKTQIEGAEESSVQTKNLLLRGAVLKSTDYIYGLVLYTGKQTKLSLNIKKPKFKLSLLDRKLNRFMIFILLLHCSIDLAMVIGYCVRQTQYSTQSFYLAGYKSNPDFLFVLFAIFSIFILNNLLIPASLFVSLEFIKAFQAKFMNWDLEMSHIGHDGQLKRMYPNTSNLNEDLSQIEFIFSDKTGTLTENLMEFNKCSIGTGILHDEKTDPAGLLTWLQKTSPKDASFEMVKLFLYSMSICNTINPDIHKKTGELMYDGSSVDEVALALAAKINGFKLLKRTQNEVEVEVIGVIEKFQVLATIEFNSDRKKMTSVIKDGNGKIWCLTKGADNKIMEILKKDDPNLEKTCENNNKFAEFGLRTLFFAYKVMSQDELDQWLEINRSAQMSTVDKLKNIDDAEKALEKDLNLIGTSAIEDLLQDKVPETIEFFRKAGVQVWILTGDKRDTAVSIGKSSRLLAGTTVEAHIRGNTREVVEKELDTCIELASMPGSDVAIILDTDSLKVCHDELVKKFIHAAKKVTCAICCRVTPLQKAMVVKLIQKKFKKVGLAIGDGANDVAMIAEATVGVGVMGREGSQAARSADYAIPRFKHLKRLLAVHGRYSLVRNSFFIQFSFYKNMLLTFIQGYYAIFCLATSTSIFDSWYITFYNLIFTVAPPIICGTFERDFHPHVLERSPALYKEIKAGLGYRLNWVTFGGWVIQAAIHSAITFFFLLGMSYEDLLMQNEIDDIWVASWFLGFTVLQIDLMKAIMELKFFNIVVVISFIFSQVLFLAFHFSYSAFTLFPLDGHSGYYFLVYETMSKAKFWLYFFLIIGTVLMVDYSCKLVGSYYIKPKMDAIYEEETHDGRFIENEEPAPKE